jgi:RNA polymerase sporulation-specific sigma factor
MSDEELISRMHEVAHEYPAIVNCLIARHTGLVNYIVNTFTIISSDRDDLIQEGMIGLFDAIGKYDPSRGASFKTYASIEIRGNVFNAIRSRNNQKNIPLNNYLSVDITGGISPELGSYFILPSNDMTPEETAIFDEIKDRLAFCINNELTEKERHCLTLKISGASVKEISDVMNLSEKAVETALSRARKKLKSIY